MTPLVTAKKKRWKWLKLVFYMHPKGNLQTAGCHADTHFNPCLVCPMFSNWIDPKVSKCDYAKTWQAGFLPLFLSLLLSLGQHYGHSLARQPDEGMTVPAIFARKCAPFLNGDLLSFGGLDRPLNGNATTEHKREM